MAAGAELVEPQVVDQYDEEIRFCSHVISLLRCHRSSDPTRRLKLQGDASRIAAASKTGTSAA
jgi:hypothetical protein